MRYARQATFAFLLALGVVTPALAHHSFNAEFDTTKPTTIHGTTVKFEFINPHCILTVDVPDATGKVTRWSVEFGNPNVLLRAGWRRDTVKPGDAVTVDGFPTRDGKPAMGGARFTLADGRQLFTGQPVELPPNSAPNSPNGPSK
jgi:Family of unknown function (DUF6152)